MNKAVLLSAQPKWCEKICNKIGENKDGSPIYEKRVEVRKTRPKLDTPFPVYIYQTKKTWVYNIFSKIADWQGKIIGKFVCDYIEDFKEFEYGLASLHRHIKLNACIDYDEIYEYLGFGKCGYGWHISNLVIYDEPKELSEFRKPCVWNYDCCTCEHWGEIVEDCCLNDSIKRPPQSWCYVEELSEW